MRKRSVFKRICGLSLAAVLALCVLSPVAVTSYGAGTGELFRDDFASGLAPGWASPSVGSAGGGTYTIDGTGHNTVSSIGDRSGVSVTAGISVTQSSESNRKNVRENGAGMLLLYTNSDASRGYEFGVAVNKNNDAFFRLYLRSGKNDSRILYQEPVTSVTDAASSYAVGIGAAAGKVVCSVAGKVVYETADGTFTSGRVGVRAEKAKAVFSGFAVASLGEKTVSDLQVVSYSNVISASGSPYFELLATYDNAFYGQETVTPDTPGVTVSGLDGSTGTKTVTVSYGGKSVSFTVRVVANLASETPLFSDNFSAGISNWMPHPATVKTKNDYTFREAAGKIQAGRVEDPGSFDTGISTSASLNAGGYEDWKYFRMEAKACITADAATKTKREALAQIIAVTENGNNLAFRVTSSGTVQLYRGSTMVSSANASGIKLGTTFTMVCEVGAGMITCYVNGKMLMAYPTDDAVIAPAPALTAHNGTVWFDDVKFTLFERKNPDMASSAQIVAMSGGAAVTSYKGNVLDMSLYCLKVTFRDGSVAYVPIREDMISGYNASAKRDQTVSVKYGPVTAKLSYIYSPHLFLDEFTGKYDPLWIMPDVNGFKVAVQQNKLHITHTDLTVNPTLFARLRNANWKNVSVSADVSFDQGRGAATRLLGLRGRSSSSGDYEMRLVHTGSAFEIRLYRHNSGKAATMLAVYKESDITAAVGIEYGMSLGTSYNLQMVLKGNTIASFVNGSLVGVYVDDSEDAVLSPGTAGFFLQGVSCMIDNFTVDARGENRPVGITLNGVKDNTFELFEGQTIVAEDYTVDVKDEDGSFTRMKLTDDMLSPYDNLKVGTQNILITAMGVSHTAKVKVSERRDEIKALTKDLEALKPSSLKLKNKSKIEKLQDRYDKFSGFEVGLISKKGRNNLLKAWDKIETLETPALKKYPVIYTDDFSKDSGKWMKTKYEGSLGKWTYVNGYYRHVERALGASGTSLLAPKDLYGDIVSVEADIKPVSGDMYSAIVMNIGPDGGYYQARISTKTRDQDQRPIATLQLYTKESGHTQIDSALPDAFGVHVETGEWFNIKMVLLDKLLHVYINDVEMITYSTDASEITHYTGSAGIKPAEGDCLYDNFRVRGIKKDPPDSKRVNEKYITPTTYKDDFEDEKTGESPSHWVESNVTDYWKVYEVAGRKAYGTKYTGGDTVTWLHVFDNNPTLKTKFMAQNAGSAAAAGFVFRLAPRTAYIRIGYDFAKSKWTLWSERNTVNYEEDIHVADETFDFKAGHWYDLEITVKDQKATVKADGKKVLEVKDFLKEGYGRVGVFASGAEAYVDDMTYTFASGDYAQDGVIEYSMAEVSGDVFSSFMEIENPSDGVLIGVHDSHVLYSDNYGQTFKDVTDTHYANWRNANGGGYTSIAKLRSGKYLRIQNQGEKILAQQTTDLINWVTVGEITDPPLLDEMGRQQDTYHVGSLTEVDMGGGKYRVFIPIAVRNFSIVNTPIGHYTEVLYSDDEGKTWQKSDFDNHDLDPGYSPNQQSWSFAEAKIIGCSDGTVRMYQSHNAWGCMEYAVSKDGGNTWEGLYQVPEMQCPNSSFAVIEDPTERGTYYMAWVNDTPMSVGNFLPRERICLVRSYDGKNWEFLANLEWATTTVPSNDKLSNDISQMLDPNVMTDDKYVYIAFGESMEQCRNTNDSLTSTHNEQRPWFVRIEKSKLKARPWDASTISDYGYTKSMKITKQPQTKYGLNDLFVLNGGEVTLTAFSGEKTVIPLSDLYCWDTLNTYKKGETKMRFYALNRSFVETTFSVVDRYKVTWKVSDGGTVKEPPLTVLDGDPLKAKLDPDAGFKATHVTVNGKEIKVEKNSFTVENVKSDLEITVTFKRSAALIILFIVLAAGVAAAGSYAAVRIVKKKKEGLKETDSEV